MSNTNMPSGTDYESKTKKKLQGVSVSLSQRVFEPKKKNVIDRESDVVTIFLARKWLMFCLIDELGVNKDRYKSLADEMDSTFAELAGY